MVVGVSQDYVELQLYASWINFVTFIYFSSSRPNGVIFKVPSESVQLASKLRVGEIASFSYESHSRREAPVNPVIYRKREDLLWDDVTSIYNRWEDKGIFFLLSLLPHNLAEPPQQPTEKEFTASPTNYWTFATMRQFLENFAKNKRFDPLLAHTWVNCISSSDVYRDKVIILFCFPQTFFELTTISKESKSLKSLKAT